MAFMLYEKQYKKGKDIYINIDEPYRLAGYNLIYEAWERKGKPVNSGWLLSKKEMSDSFEDGKEYAFLIDFDPSSDYRIGIIEINKIYVYTYGDNKDKTVWWSPLMLELNDILNLTEDDIDLKEKAKILRRIEIDSNKKSFIEFLYLNGEKWNWGRNGSTNAAFIQDEARAYFKQFF
jgi:hypothetical protein